VTIRTRNLDALQAHHPDLARALAELPSDPEDVQILETRSGDPTAVRRGLSLHSRHAPRAEAERLAERELPEAPSAVIIMGFGLGYTVEAVRRRFPELPILVLEPDARMFRAALGARELAGILSDERIQFLVAGRPQEVASLLPSLPLAKPAFLRLRPAVESDPAWYRTAEEVVHSWLLRQEINHNTLTRFGRLWVKNLGRNVNSLASAPGVSRLKDLCRGLPALVVAGGPSLDDILPSLAALRERLVIISVATPLKRCVQAGVRPDFVVVVDPQYWASRFMDWSLPEGAGEPLPIVVAEPSTHPRLLRDPAGRERNAVLYLSSSLFPLGEALEAAVGEKGKLGAGGSVSTAAWDLARHLGASPIYTAGLDLGYPGMRTHCRGVFTEELWLSACKRLRPVETSSFGYLREIGLFPVRSAGGGLTLTDRRMLLYTWWFENQLSMQAQATTFTLCAGSVAVSGMPLASVADLMTLPPVRNEIDARLRAEEKRAHAEARSAAKLPALREAMNGLLAGLEELAALSSRALTANEALAPALRGAEKGAGKVRALLAELDQIDERILEVSHRGIAGFLMQAVIRRIEGQGEGEATREQTLADGEQLYRAILESARWQKTVIQRALSEL
jgi:hypothetical protein